MRRLLLVEDEEDLRWSLVRMLARALTGWEVLESGTYDTALEIASRGLDCLITDVKLGEHSGVELILALRRKQPSLPCVVITAFPTEADRMNINHMARTRYLEKPFPPDQLLSAVEDLEQQGQKLTGEMVVDGLPDILQLVALSPTPTVLKVTRGTRQGSVWCERGKVLHAETETQRGIEAFMELATWTGGRFSTMSARAPPERTVDVPVMELLLEAARIHDENGARSDDPVVELEFAVDGGHDPPRSEATPNATATPTHPRDNNQQGEVSMSNIKELVGSLKGLDGYIGSCVVDAESGMTLSTDGGAGVLNMDAAAAGNTEVVRAKRKTMKSLGLKDEIEDMLITLGAQYHLIRPLRKKASVFIYIALDRAKANLGLARHTLADAEKAFEL